MRVNNDNNCSTVKLTHDYFQKFLNESAFIQQELSSFSSILSKSYISLVLKQTNWKTLTLSETKDIKERVWSMMSRIKEKIQRECSMIVEVTACVRKVSHQFQQLIEIMKNEQERSTSKIAELQNQIKKKEGDIRKCQILVEEERNKQIEQSWRKLHYVNSENFDGNEVSGLTYMKVLQDIKAKLNIQVFAQHKEHSIFNANVMSKLKDFRTKILKIWYILPHYDNDQCSLLSLSPKEENQMKRQISELEKRYLIKEQEIDEFQIGKLADIKKKLKLLEEAEMSQSREYLNYSASAENQIVIESEVIEIGKS